MSSMHPMPRSQEVERSTASGYLMLAVGLALVVAGIFLFIGINAVGPRALFLATDRGA